MTKKPAQPKKIRTPAGEGPARGLWYLAAWRASRGWSQEQVAEKLKTTKGTVSKLETGGRDMSEAWIKSYAQAFGVSPADLMRHPADIGVRPQPEPVSDAIPPALAREAMLAAANILGMNDIVAQTVADAVLEEISNPKPRRLVRREDEIGVAVDRIIRQALPKSVS